MKSSSCYRVSCRYARCTGIRYRLAKVLAGYSRRRRPSPLCWKISVRRVCSAKVTFASQTGLPEASHGDSLHGRVSESSANMTSALGVSWEKMVEATGIYKEFYCKWRPKVEKGVEVEPLKGIFRAVVVEVMEESRDRRAYNWAEFPYDGPRRGELPGFFALKETVDTEKLKMNHHAIHREAGFLEAYGYWAELGTIAHDLATEMAAGGFNDASAGDSDAVKAASREKRLKKEDRIGVMMGLSRVLAQVSVDCMRQRKRFVAMCGTEGLDTASWMMDHVVQAGRVGESEAFGASEKMMREKKLDERLKIRAKMEAHRMENAKYVPDPDVVSARGAAPDGEPSARRN